MRTLTRPTTELAVGQTIADPGPRGTTKRIEVKSVEWSRRREWCIVNNSLVYSYGGTYERPALEVTGERVAEATAKAADAMTKLATAASEVAA